MPAVIGTARDRTFCPDNSITNPSINAINILRRFDRTIEATPLIESPTSIILSKKYPGRKLVKSIDAINRSQFSKGIVLKSTTAPVYGFTKNTAKAERIANISNANLIFERLKTNDAVISGFKRKLKKKYIEIEIGIPK